VAIAQNFHQELACVKDTIVQCMADSFPHKPFEYSVYFERADFPRRNVVFSVYATTDFNATDIYTDVGKYGSNCFVYLDMGSPDNWAQSAKEQINSVITKYFKSIEARQIAPTVNLCTS
jgi:hypothetical protein